ncbi:dipeptide/oligopeptide/nickel ABC transporter permease/ATP-binding protein [Catellatospora sp. KI3]|uniref:dipeptide/oligopeptide/nickel ABC transporter permease/ATP-binding protein n=1 Tax=Catellatospora sp. KI3 TaxID=3041620 RepID=UPI0024826C07|nr:dipeptide/oligopeptide/nickel ABC transporter permease/ATP-binding protein [Catellatospora sp. KI3]MDI1461455.1 dipeptide/oligopeptide/nickel ABC transporter permease/ATP-binding protein [Catellatospora sp. KI3]
MTRAPRQLARTSLTVLATLWLGVLAVAVLAPGLLTGRDPLEQDLTASLQTATGEHLLGTDRLGRDLLSRLVHGTGTVLWGVAVAVVVAVVLGTVLGLIAGYFGGLLDAAVMRLSDLLFAVPGIILLLVVASTFPNDVTIAMTAFGVIMASGLIRVVRGATRSLRAEQFIAAAKVAGLSDAQILWRHALPRLLGLVIVQASLIAAVTVVTQAGLAFLGFGPPPPAPTWGGLMDEGRAVMAQSAWPLLPPGAAVALTVLAFLLIGDAVRDRTTGAWSTSKLARPNRRRSRIASGEADVSASPAVLKVRGLSAAIPDRVTFAPRTVVTDASFEIDPGEIVGLVGESGSGKTVTALSVLGLTPGGGTVTGGSCMFEGLDLVRATARQWRDVRGRGIGYVAQDSALSLDPSLRVGAQLAAAVRRHTGVNRRVARSRAAELLAAVELTDPAVARRYPHQLSGGMAQRAAIAYALAGSPRLLIADEPTTALDMTVQASILALLRRLSRDRSMAVLLVTHDLGVVAQLCDRVVVMYAGQVVERCTTDELFTGPRHPYSAALLAADPSRARFGQPLPVIAGTAPVPGAWPRGCRMADRCSLVTDQCRAAEVPLLEYAHGSVARCIRVAERQDAVPVS